jgi:hypothetical protein
LVRDYHEANAVHDSQDSKDHKERFDRHVDAPQTLRQGGEMPSALPI